MTLRESTSDTFSQVDDYVSRVARVASAILDAAERIEHERRLPPDLLSALHGEKLFRLLLPKTYGGEEVDPPTFFETIMAAAACDGSTAWCLCQANGCAMTAAYLEPTVAREIWGDDPEGVLAWGPGKSEVTIGDDGYRVSGKWSFASGSRHATWLGGHSILTGSDGEPVRRTMLFPATSVEMLDIWNVIGLRGTASDAYTVTDVFVRHDHSVSRDNPAERRCDRPLYWLPTTNLYATGFSATALGIARAMIEDFKDIAQTKLPRRATQVLRESSVVQAEVALSEARLGSARAYMLTEIAEVWEDVKSRGELTRDSRARVRLASTYAIQEAKIVADTVYDAAGATAIFADTPFERRFRDIHTVTQQIQGRKAHFETVGAFMLGLEVDLNSD